MAHIVVEQLRLARQKWMEGLDGVSQAEGFKRLGQMNSIGWMVGHLASFEQFAWLEIAQGQVISEAVKACRFGQPPSTPPLDEMVAAWHQIIEASNPYLDSLTNEQLVRHLSWRGQALPDNIGTLIWRFTWHYWYHLGEMQAIRQMLGHKDLPQFVGSIPANVGFSLESMTTS